MFGILLLTPIFLITRAEKDYTEKKLKCLSFFIVSVEERGQMSMKVKLSIYFPHLSDIQCYIFYLKSDLLFPLYIESFFARWPYSTK